jgi:hypothetical protein
MNVNLAETGMINQGNLLLVRLRDARLPADDPHPFVEVVLEIAGDRRAMTDA